MAVKVNSLDLNKLIFDLNIREAIYEHLFSDEFSDRYKFTHVALTPAECAGLFEEWNEGYEQIRDSTMDCLYHSHIERAAILGSMWFPGQNNDTIIDNVNLQLGYRPELEVNNKAYEANTESNTRHPRILKIRPRAPREYATPGGDVKLPKFKGHSIYKKYPWLHNFRIVKGIPVTYLSYSYDYPLYSGWNTNDNDTYYEEERYYIALINYGEGYGSLFVLTPNPFHGADKTQILISMVRDCAAGNTPRPNFLTNVPNAAKTMRRLGHVRTLSKQLPSNVIRKGVLPFIGSEHIASRKTSKTRKTRKQRK
jgi:hypothetical protein